MRRVGGRGLLLVLAWAAGCSSGDGTVGRRDRTTAPKCELEGVTACSDDAACGAGMRCSDGCCLAACAAADDCGADACGPSGCVCDEGACRARTCSADAECAAGQACSAGTCVAMPDAALASTCTVAPRWSVLRAGATRPLSVQAYDASGRPLPIHAGFTFASDEPSRVAVDEAGTARAEGGAGTATITASLGGASCTAEVLAFAPPPEGTLRAVVVDELTGLPVANAQVQVETGAVPLTATTDATGAATFALAALPAGTRTISAFPADYAYVTVAGTGATDLLLPVRRLVPADRAGGFRGTFGPAEIFHPDNVQAGVAGTSIPGNLIDLSFSILIGPSRLTRVTIGNERDVRIPSGVVLGLGNTFFKQEYQALGVPGVCEDRARTASGTCGVRTAWGVAGGVPLLDLPIDEITEGGEDLSVGALLSQLLPHFQRFRSAVARDVSFDLQPAAGGGPAWDAFTRVDLRATARMALRSTVALPQLPRLGDGWLDGAIVFGAADVPDRGVVPLGLTAGVDADTAAGETPDGRIDELALRIAPLHGGLEGSDYVVLALAANFAGMSAEGGRCAPEDRSGCAAVSGLVDRAPSYPFDRRVDFAAGQGFVAPAEGASWNDAARTFATGGVPAGGANVMRVKLSAGDGRVWHVWLPADAGEVAVPMPAGVADRAAGARASVQALRLSVGLDELVRFDESSLADLVGLLSGFSTVDLP